MTHQITADHLVNAASKTVTEELFREFNKALQSSFRQIRKKFLSDTKINKKLKQLLFFILHSNSKI